MMSQAHVPALGGVFTGIDAGVFDRRPPSVKTAALVAAALRSSLSALQRLLRNRRLLLAVLILSPTVLLTAGALLFGHHLQALHTVGYFGIFLTNVVASGTIILPVPGLAAAFVAGGLWNPMLVALAGATGSALGEITAMQRVWAPIRL